MGHVQHGRNCKTFGNVATVSVAQTSFTVSVISFILLHAIALLYTCSMERQRLSGSLPLQGVWSPQGTAILVAKPAVGHGVNELSFSMKAELERSIVKHLEKSKLTIAILHNLIIQQLG